MMNVDVLPNGCRVSRYSVGTHGYAQVGWQDGGDRGMVLAHRAAWELDHDPVPPGQTLDHTCKNRLCVNVDHLRVIENFENARRTNGRDWPIGECARGHDNSQLVRRQRGPGKPSRLRCIECEREDQRAYRERKAA
jgi:hypothetical protein